MSIATDELLEAVELGLSDPQIADRLGCNPRTVLRWRSRLGIAPGWTYSVPAHGTIGRYRGTARVEPCRCELCRAENNRARLAYLAYAQRRTIDAPRWQTPWTPEEDAVLLDASLGTVVDRANRLGRTYSAATQRLTRLREARQG